VRRLLLGSVGDSPFGEGIVLLLVVVLLRTVVEGCDDDAFVVVLALSLVRTRLDADPGIDDDDGPDFIAVVLDVLSLLTLLLLVNPFASLILLYVLILGLSVPVFFVVVVVVLSS